MLDVSHYKVVDSWLNKLLFLSGLHFKIDIQHTISYQNFS